MKTLQELLQDWGNSTCGREPEQYIYDYMEEQAQAYADQQVKAEREKVIEHILMVMKTLEIEYSVGTLTWDDLKIILKELKIKQP